MSNRTKQLLSIVLCFAVYSAFINWKVALLLVISVCFHEQSHLWAAKHLKLRTNLFYMIPFVGGFALITERYKRYSQQAFVAIMGPVGGCALAVVTALVWYVTGWQVLALAAAYMSVMNLFNLAPLAMLDGGQLLDTITYSFNRTLGLVVHTISTAIAIVLITWKANMTIGILIAVYGIPSIIAEFKNWQAFKAGTFYLCTQSYLFPPSKSSKKVMLLTAGAWAATCLVLISNFLFVAHGAASSFSSLFSK